METEESFAIVVQETALEFEQIAVLNPDIIRASSFAGLLSQITMIGSSYRPCMMLVLGRNNWEDKCSGQKIHADISVTVSWDRHLQTSQPGNYID